MIDESGYDISLQIDGGVSAKNIAEIAEAGVDMFVAGSARRWRPRLLCRARRGAGRAAAACLAAARGSGRPGCGLAWGWGLQACSPTKDPDAPFTPFLRFRHLQHRRLRGDHQRHARRACQGAFPGQGRRRRLSDTRPAHIPPLTPAAEAILHEIPGTAHRSGCSTPLRENARGLACGVISCVKAHFRSRLSIY